MTQDMSGVIVPKSDQINADDFVAGPRSYKIKSVAISPGSEQPVTIELEGSKPWRPCKSMSRLLVAAWGADAKEYAGRSVTLYKDPKVKWGGLEVGGIRVSHLSHIDREMVVALTMTKGKRAPYTVKPLKADVAPLKVVEKGGVDNVEVTSFDFAAFENVVKLGLLAAENAEETTAWWNSLLNQRKAAGAADKERAIAIATKVKEKIAALEAGDSSKEELF